MRKYGLPILALGSIASLIAVLVFVFRGQPGPDPPVEDPFDFAAALEAMERELAEAPDARGERHLQAARLARRADTFERAARYLDDAGRRGADADVVGLEKKLLRAQQGYAHLLRRQASMHVSDCSCLMKGGFERMGLGSPQLL